MPGPGERLVARWAAEVGVGRDRLPPPGAFDRDFGPDACRPGASLKALDSWERRHGFRLPTGLRAWLRRSDGLYRAGDPLIHPLDSIGPMVPFARVPDLVIQPESWFELGNPGEETVCIDLAYRWPGGDFPLFASGDDQRRTRPRMIATGFDAWFVRLLNEGGRAFWLDPAFEPLGDPWAEHRHRAPAPPLPERLRPLAPQVRSLMHPGADDRRIAHELGISRGDVEALFRHLQHGGPGY
jgi:hypothetical protein